MPVNVKENVQEMLMLTLISCVGLAPGSLNVS